MAAVDVIGKGPIIGAGTNRVGIVTGDKRAILTSNSETVTLKTGGAFLHSVVIGTTGTTWQIDFYDDLAGSAHKVWTWLTADGKGPFALQIPLYNGLTVVESGSAAGQATVIFS